MDYNFDDRKATFYVENMRTFESFKATLYFDHVQREFDIPVSFNPTIKMQPSSREATPYFDSARF